MKANAGITDKRPKKRDRKDLAAPGVSIHDEQKESKVNEAYEQYLEKYHGGTHRAGDEADRS